jgi:HPt (histidine-containing phosphotransfer) domain-containing protein
MAGRVATNILEGEIVIDGRLAALGFKKRPNIEVEPFIAFFGKRESLFRELVDLFLKNVPPKLNQLESAMAVNDLEAAAKIAHTFVSSFANLYATDAVNFSRELEEAARSEASDVARIAFAKLKPEAEDLIAKLSDTNS